ncbi:methyltransferase [Terrimonas sp.]|uniref:O-methyltransferase n=1 Tax=Terrimonas sp. TaxID=1914338 RepID=UPI000D521004|nr:O-methyltransferase [Terrimonas sp.]PVD51954.1 methyltransferase [Terrimonas sp.]
MEFLHPLAEAYAARYTTNDDTLLKEVADFTNEKHPKAHMLSGAVQGKLLEMLSRMIQPRRILEIGTFTGYSALCLAKGLTEDGLLYTIEIRVEDAETAQFFFNKSIVKDRIILRVGNAHEIIPALHEAWDIVFIDADKVSYIDYFNIVLPKVKSGGYIIADNVLFHGEVLEEEKKGKNAKAVHAFNEYIKQDERVVSVLLTVRDGLLLVRKK